MLESKLKRENGLTKVFIVNKKMYIHQNCTCSPNSAASLGAMSNIPAVNDQLFGDVMSDLAYWSVQQVLTQRVT